MDNDIMAEIEKRITERYKAIQDYELLNEKFINLSVLLETSLRKIPVLIKTAEISNSTQKTAEGTSYAVMTCEAYNISKAEVGFQLNKSFDLCNESNLISLKINELIGDLVRKDREFLTNLRDNYSVYRTDFVAEQNGRGIEA